MSEPLVVVASFPALPGKLEEAIAELTPIVEQIQGEPGCLLYALHASEQGRLYLIEKWASKADGDRHGASSPALALLAERVSPLLDMSAGTFEELRPIPVGADGRGAL